MTIRTIRESKGSRKLVMLTAYDAITAAFAAAGGADIILVGDSLANTALGLPDTLGIGLASMLEKTAAVTRAAGSVPVVCDMPFLSYGASRTASVRNCGLALKQAGACAVKLEGGAWLAPLVRRLVRIGIPVMGHVGLQPQHVHEYGGMFVRGREPAEAEGIIRDAHVLQEAGVFSLVVECVPAALGKRLTDELAIPVIGIGAGPDTDGQVQVISDLLGLKEGKVPKHATAFADLFTSARDAVGEYARRVREGSFPGPDNSF